MKIAVKENEVYVDYDKRFTDEEISSAPYNYCVVEIDPNINVEQEKIIVADFDVAEGKYSLNVARYSDRMERAKSQNAVATYKNRVESAIREIYSVSDELAILRQRDVKVAEFQEYCEKVEAIKCTQRS